MQVSHVFRSTLTRRDAGAVRERRPRLPWLRARGAPRSFGARGDRGAPKDKTAWTVEAPGLSDGPENDTLSCCTLRRLTSRAHWTYSWHESSLSLRSRTPSPTRAGPEREIVRAARRRRPGANAPRRRRFHLLARRKKARLRSLPIGVEIDRKSVV